LEGKYARAAPPGHAAAVRALEEKCQALKARAGGLEERLARSEERRQFAERALEEGVERLPPPPCEACPGQLERIKRLEVTVAGVESEKRKVLEKVKAQSGEAGRLKKIIEEEKRLLRRARQEAKELRDREHEGEEKLADAVRRVRDEVARGSKSKDAELEKAKRAAAACMQKQAELATQSEALESQVSELQRELRQTQVTAAQAGVRHEREMEALRAVTAEKASLAGQQELSVDYLTQKMQLLTESLEQVSFEGERLRQSLRQSEAALNRQQLEFARKLCEIEKATQTVEEKQRQSEESGGRRLLRAKDDITQLLLQLDVSPPGAALEGAKKAPVKFQRGTSKMGPEQLKKLNRELAELNAELLLRADEWQRTAPGTGSEVSMVLPHEGRRSGTSKAQKAHDAVVGAGHNGQAPPLNDGGAAASRTGSFSSSASLSREIGAGGSKTEAAERAVLDAADDLHARLKISSDRAELLDLKARHEEQSTQLQQARDQLEGETQHGQALFMELSELRKAVHKEKMDNEKLRKTLVSPESVQDLRRKIHDLEAAAKQRREVVQRKTLSYESARSDNERKDASLKEQAACIDELTSEVLTLRDDLKRKEACLESYKTRVAEMKENIAGQGDWGSARRSAPLDGARERPSTAPIHGKRGGGQEDTKVTETLKEALQEIENLQVSLEKSRHHGKNKVLLADARVRQLNQQLEWTRDEYIREIEGLQQERGALRKAVSAYEEKLGAVTASSAKNAHELGRTQSRNARLERDLEKTNMQLDYFRASYADRLREKEKESRELAMEAGRKDKVKGRLQDCTAFVINCP
tara:strand:- start:853 stop:3300 length:2448 start_codon:yes stop_codon:yes gene_type:complete